jgi:hypothetical protein
MSAMTDPMEISGIVRNACIQAALEGYEQAQIAGLCQEGAWECAVDAMRMVDLKVCLEKAPRSPLPPAPASP